MRHCPCATEQKYNLLWPNICHTACLVVGASGGGPIGSTVCRGTCLLFYLFFFFSELISWTCAAQSCTVYDYRSKNCREELQWWWCHHECELTPKSFPAHLHSSLFNGVAGHAICANERMTKSNYTGGGEERFTCWFMKQEDSESTQWGRGNHDLCISRRMTLDLSCLILTTPK